jgi:hypothetical protein
MIKKNVTLISGARQGSSYLYAVLKSYINPHHHGGPFEGYDEFVNRDFFFNKGYTSEEFIHQIAVKLEYLEKSPMSIVSKHHHDQFFQLKEENQGLLFRLLNVNSYNILLLRKDLFETSLSHALSVQTGEWTKYLATDMIDIDYTVFENSLKYCYSTLVNQITNPFKIKYDEVKFYDDLTFVPKKDFYSLGFNIIHEENIKDFDVTPFVEKAPNKRERVANYEELLNQTREFIYNQGRHERFDFCDTRLVNVEVKNFQ